MARPAKDEEEAHPLPRDALERKRPRGRPQKRLDWRLEEVAKAVWGDYCQLQLPLNLALAVRETVAGHRLGALGGVEGVTPPPPLPTHPYPCPPSCGSKLCGNNLSGAFRAFVLCILWTVLTKKEFQLLFDTEEGPHTHAPQAPLLRWVQPPPLPQRC